MGTEAQDAVKVSNVLVLTKYGGLGASSRLRFLQYLPWMEQSNVEVNVQALISDELLLMRYQRGAYGLWPLLKAYADRIKILYQGRLFDVVWIEKEALPWFPFWLELWLLRRVPYVLDFDDAIFHSYDMHRSAWVRIIYGRRIDRLMEGAQLVIAGNQYLADRAVAAGARRVELMPTVVDLARYPVKSVASIATKPRVVWIGSPSTVQYLQELAVPLGKLSKRQAFTLRVIGGGNISMQGVDVELVDWTAETEARAIVECDVGIMPLRDTPWEQGKCAYKLIQYMACGLPTVASPIGVNRDVIIDGETGFFADADSAWMEKIELLLRDAGLRQRLGLAGRARVEAKYCLQQTGPQLAHLLTAAGAR